MKTAFGVFLFVVLSVLMGLYIHQGGTRTNTQANDPSLTPRELQQATPFELYSSEEPVAESNTHPKYRSSLRSAYEGITAPRHKSKEDPNAPGSHTNQDEAGTFTRFLKADDQSPGGEPTSLNKPIDASPPNSTELVTSNNPPSAIVHSKAGEGYKPSTQPSSADQAIVEFQAQSCELLNGDQIPGGGGGETYENCECRSNCGGGTSCSSVSIGECATGQICCCGADCETSHEPSSQPSSQPSSRPSSQPSSQPSECQDLPAWKMPADSIWDGTSFAGQTCAELEALIPSDQPLERQHFCDFLSRGIFTGPCANEAVRTQR